AAVSHRRDGQRDVDERAVLAPPHGLEVLHRFAAAETLQDTLLLLAPVGRNDEEDRLADRLGRRVAEELLGRPVPRRDGAVQRLADDRVVGRFHDGSESRRRLTDPFLHRDSSWWMIARTAGGPARQRSVTAEVWRHKPRRPVWENIFTRPRRPRSRSGS